MKTKYFPSAFRQSFVILFFSFLTSTLQAQTQDLQNHIWYFGDSPDGLIFSKGNNQPSTLSDQNNSLGYGIGGPAVVTDQETGELLFYTDGNNVFNNLHQPMTNGGGLNANPDANQAVAVLPVPGEEDQYYILTNTANGTTAGSIFYSIVDLSRPGNSGSPLPPQGEVSSKNQNTGLPSSTEAMAVFATGANPNFRYWLVVQEFGTNDIHLYEIQTGNNFVLTNTVTLTANINAANFAIHRPSQRIAVAPLNTGVNIQILSVSAGTISQDTAVVNSGNLDGGNYAVYDTEWSLDGTKLYFSRTGGGGQNGQLLRKDFSQPTASIETIPTSTLFRSYGLQNGPDGRMYHLYQESSGGPLLLGRVDSTNNVRDSVYYNSAPFGNTNFNSRQFPAFAPDKAINLTGAFDLYGTCSGNPTHFFPNVEPQAENIQWDFGDGNQSSNPVPIHQYGGPGSYRVVMRYTVNGVADSAIQTVDVLQGDSVDLGADTVICPGETLTLDAGSGGVSYRWSVPGETGQTIDVDSAGLYWVVKDNGTCTSYDAISVTVYGEQNQYYNYWYFGEMAGLDFNSGTAVAVTDGNLNSPAGSATYSDPNGDLILYTDGNTVYDRDHNNVQSNIGGDNNSTQSSLIVPVPQDSTLFYVFTTEDIWDDPDHTYRLKYSLYDMKELATNPVVEFDKTLYYKSTERLAALNVAQGDNWLLSHEFGTNTFRSYPVTGNGIGNPVLSSVGSVHGIGPKEAGEGYMQIAPSADKVAVAMVNQQNENIVEIFDFDQGTGELSNPVTITFSEAFPAFQAYGVEFSGNGNKLFVTLKGNPTPSRIYELPLFYMNEDSITANMQQMAEVNETLGALQMAPDNQIYVAVDGQNFVARFSPDEDTASVSTFDINNQVDLAGRTSRLGLPDHVQFNGTSTGGPAMAVTDGCLGTPSNFTATPTSMIDEFFWDYVEGTSTNDTLTHTFQNSGDFDIELTISNRCNFDTTLTQTITINPPPLEPTVDNPEIICSSPLDVDANDVNDPSIVNYQWSTGDTTKVVTFNQGFSNVTVTLTDSVGCQSDSTFQVFDARPQIGLPNDFTVCQNENVSDLDAGDWDAYAWTINGSPAGNSRFQSVDTSTPGTFQYMVTVDDNFTGCTNTDSVTITINETPQATYTVTNSTCGNSDGAISIDAGSLTANTSVTWFDNTGTQVGTGNSITSIPSGTYTLQLTHDLNGCTQTYSIPVLDDMVPFSIDAAATIDCNNASFIDVTLSGTVTDFGSIVYDLIDQSTSQSVRSGTPNTLNFQINNISPGTYDLVISADACTDDSTDIVIDPDPLADLQVNSSFDVCEGSASISATSNTGSPSFDWQVVGGSSLTSSETGSSPTTSTADLNSLSPGTYNVSVTVSSGTTCPNSDTVQVRITETPQASINVTEDGCGGSATLQAEGSGGSGNYSYVWSTGQTSQSIIVNSSGNYSVDIRDNASGCLASAGPENVTITQPIDITFTWEPIPCQDGNQLSVTAVTNVTPDRYTWYQNDVLLQNDTTETVTTFGDGVFRVEVERDGCTDQNSVSLFRFPLTPVDIQPDTTICPQPPVNGVFEIEIDESRFQNVLVIDTINNTEIFNGLQPSVTLTEESVYRFTFTDNNGCNTVAVTSITERCEPTVLAPNAFSPQANINENTTFQVYPRFVKDFEIWIYNRWGELIFYSDNLDFKWDGTKNGEIQPAGTYAYVMRFKSTTEENRGFIEKTGGVHLLK